MIHHALSVLAGELNSFLKGRFNLNEDRVVLSELVNLDGGVAVSGENKVVGTLINVEQERTNLNKLPRQQGGLRMNPPVNLNLYVLFSCHFPSANYVEALKFLSALIGFFQGKQVFTPQNTPQLGHDIEKITVELTNLDMRELSNFWNAVGAKHLPSVLYKLRMISITEAMILEEIPEIKGLDTESRNR